MNIRHLFIFLALLAWPALAATAQKAKLLTQQNLAAWNIQPANYSGIAPVGDNSYALVDDKSPTDGFYLINIDIDTHTGQITNITPIGFRGPKNAPPSAARADCEDVVWVSETQTLFITHESTGQVKEYRKDGSLTGRELSIPDYLSRKNQAGNGGFESLAYNPAGHTFWLTTENHLTTDSPIAINGKQCQPLHLQSFGADLKPARQWAYLMEAPKLDRNVKFYTHGVPALTALPDGRLIIMERELSVPANYLGSKCHISLFLVDPRQTPSLAQNTTLGPAVVQSESDTPDGFLPKRPVAEFTTHIRFGALNYANYEGLCLGPRLADGRQTLLLINDSQAGAGNSLYTLKDYIKVIILPKNF